MRSTASGLFVKERRENLLARWRKKMLAAYPADSAKFYGRECNGFANPVGQTIIENGEQLLNLVLDEGTDEEVRAALDPIIRIRAVQELSPSAALAFVPALKTAFREEIQELHTDNATSNALAALDARVDEVLLVAFDQYVLCREEVATIRVREAGRHVSGLLRRLGVAEWLGSGEPPESGSSPPRGE